MKGIILALFVLLTHTASAQQSAIKDFQTKSSSHSPLYNGQIEIAYNPHYKRLPYYSDDKFTDGEIMVDSLIYSQIKMRLDLNIDEVIITNGGKGFPIIVPHQKVNYIKLHNATFRYIYKGDYQGASINQGYFRVMYAGKSNQLVCREHNYPTEAIVDNNILEYSFENKKGYYLITEGRIREVSNARSFYKIYPQHKAQIRAFIKSRHIRFRKSKETALTQVAEFCDSLNR